MQGRLNPKIAIACHGWSKTLHVARVIRHNNFSANARDNKFRGLLQPPAALLPLVFYSPERAWH